MVMKSNFNDTVAFILKPDLNPDQVKDVLDKILKIKGIFGLLASATEPGKYEARMEETSDNIEIGCNVRWIEGVETTIITPKAFLELTARIEARGPQVK